MRLWIGCLVLLVAASEVSAVSPNPFAEQEPDSWVLRVEYADKRLWVLEESGKLSAVEEGKAERSDSGLKDPVLDLWLQNGVPMVVTQPKAGRPYTIRRWAHGKWDRLASAPSQNDQLFAAGSYGDDVTLVTDHHLIDIESGRVQSFPVSWGRFNGTPSALIMQDSVLVGMNAGEWGGGLRVVDRRNGAVSEVPCDECAPVTGIAPEPGKPGCAVVAMGIVHLLEAGKLVEVCGVTSRALYEKPTTMGFFGMPIDVTMPFFGLSTAGGQIRAIGVDGVYRVAPDGTAAEHTALPEFQDIGGFKVSFAIPDVVLVLTDINAHRSLSGRTPLIVGR